MPGTAQSSPATPQAAPDAELDAIRRVFGVSQAEIATILGTTPRTVSRWRSTSAAHVAPRPGAARRLLAPALPRHGAGGFPVDPDDERGATRAGSTAGLHGQARHGRGAAAIGRD